MKVKKLIKQTGLMLAVLAIPLVSCGQQEQSPPAVPKEKPKAASPAKAVPKTATAPDAGKVLATVGDEKITEESVFAPLAMMPPQFRSRYETPEGRKKLFERAIQMSLLAQEARSLNIDKKEEIARRIREMTDQLIVQELTKQEVLDKIAVSDADVEQHYNRNKDSYVREEKVRVNLIMVKMDDNATEKVKEEKKAVAGKALDRVKKGEDFEAVAKDVSDDKRTKSRGGNTGLFSRGKRENLYGAAFEEKAFSLPAGALSDVFQGKGGYYVIKVVEKKPREQEKFDDVKARIERQLKTEKQKESMESYLDGLKQKYPVKVVDPSMQ